MMLMVCIYNNESIKRAPDYGGAARAHEAGLPYIHVATHAQDPAHTNKRA